MIEILLLLAGFLAVGGSVAGIIKSEAAVGRMVRTAQGFEVI